MLGVRCGACGVGRAVWGVLCGACGVGRAVWGVRCGACGVGRAVWGVLCGACCVGRAVWGVLAAPACLPLTISSCNHLPTHLPLSANRHSSLSASVPLPGWLPAGSGDTGAAGHTRSGSLVIEETEALVAIDVNYLPRFLPPSSLSFHSCLHALPSLPLSLSSSLPLSLSPHQCTTGRRRVTGDRGDRGAGGNRREQRVERAAPLLSSCLTASLHLPLSLPPSSPHQCATGRGGLAGDRGDRGAGGNRREQRVERAAAHGTAGGHLPRCQPHCCQTGGRR
ncbi:unnamed protein product [Closterium sp. NIES-53]